MAYILSSGSKETNFLDTKHLSAFFLLMTCVFLNESGFLVRPHHLSTSIFLSFSILSFGLCCKIGLHSAYSSSSSFFPPSPNGRTLGLQHLRCSSYDSSLLHPYLGNFATGGDVKSDEDDLESACAVIGVFTPPGEDKRGKNHLIEPQWIIRI